MQSSGQMSWQPPQRMHSVPSAGLLFEDRVRPAVEASGPLEPRLVLREALFDLGDADAARDGAGGRLLTRDALVIEVPFIAIVDVDLDLDLGRQARPAPEEAVDRRAPRLPSATALIAMRGPNAASPPV